jgi:TRAP transporter TAXI family solute receptor
VRQYLRMLAAMIMMASGVAAHAEQTDYDPAKVSDSLKAVFKFGSVSTTKALNANTVTMLSGTIGGTYVQFGADLASVLDDGGNLRVLPIIGRGSVQSVADILFLKGVDLGIVRTDTLDYLEKKGFANDIKKRFTYVTKLYNEEMHVVAPKTIKTLNDLEGKTVSVDLPNGGTFVTALTVFERLGIKANFVYIEQRIAMEKLKKGDLDAVIVVGGKPYVSVTTFNNDGRFHLAAVDYSKPLQSDYLPATLTSKDYPNLIPEGETVDTIAVPSVLAAYNWAPNTERSRKLALFVDAFFTKFAALQNPPFHPKWKEVSLSAPLAGWNRLPLAQQWLDKHGVEPIKRRFEAFQQENPAAANIQQENPAAANIKSEADKEVLLRQFQAWDARAQFRAWDARAQMGSEVDSDKVRDRDQSATQAAPPRDSPRRSHFARRALGRLIEQGAVTEAFQQENPAAANIKSEVDKEALLRQFHAWDARAQFQAWDARAQMGSEMDSNKVRDGDQSATQAAPPRHPPRRSPPGATQGISTTDYPSSDFPERQYVFR